MSDIKEDINIENTIEVKNLSVEYHSGKRIVKAVNNVSFNVEKGKTLGLVGETGAGKTTIALALMGLLPERTAKISSGSIKVKNDYILKLKEHQLSLMRGNIMSMIFQDPMTALNPIMSVGSQIAETLKIHSKGKLSKKELGEKVDKTLELVGIPAQRKNEYPMQFSGGMKQRIVIAIALACNPDVIIADEPTTALDVTIQAQVLSLLEELKQKLGTSLIMITHDLGIVVRSCDDVGVMYAGQIIEYGTVEQIFSGKNHHPYTEGLFGAMPDMNSDEKRLKPIDGLMPDPTKLPIGCKFSQRCPKSIDKCNEVEPQEYTFDGHLIKCHLYGGENHQ